MKQRKTGHGLSLNLTTKKQLQTRKQAIREEEVCCDSTTEAEMADSKNELPDEETEENASSDEDTSLVSLADSILDIDAEESPEAEDEAAAEPKIQF